MEENKIPDTEVWEAIQLISGEVCIYRNGYKEEADIKDVIRLDAGVDTAGRFTCQFARFDFHPAKPAPNSTIRVNRSAIVFAWYVDPTSEMIANIKKAMLQMNAQSAGLILPGQGLRRV